MLQSLNLEAALPELILVDRRHGAADARRLHAAASSGELILWLAVLLLAVAGVFVATMLRHGDCCSATASSSIPSRAC